MSISEKCADFIVKYREKISRVFWGLLGISLILSLFVQVNYDLSKYLPESSLTQQGIHKMEDSFGYPGTARIMLKDVSMGEALSYKERIEHISGVDRVSFSTGSKSAYAPEFMEERRRKRI